MTTIPIDDVNLSEELDLARKARIKKNSHIWLDEAKEILAISFLSSYCVKQVMVELEDEFLNRQRGELDIVSILRIYPSYREVEIFTSPGRALEIEVDFFRSVTNKNKDREKRGIPNPVNSSEWADYLSQRYNELYPKKS